MDLFVIYNVLVGMLLEVMNGGSIPGVSVAVTLQNFVERISTLDSYRARGRRRHGS